MNIKKSLLALTLVSAFGANASPIFIDVGTDYDGDGNSVSGVFDKFTFGTFNPTSAYLDADQNGQMEQGNMVFDSAFGIEVASLNYTTDNEAYNTNVPAFGLATYTLVADYEFFGFAGFNDLNSNNVQDAGEAIGAQFVGGYVNLFMKDISTSSMTQVLALDVTGSGADLGGTGVNFNIKSDIVTIADDFFHSAYSIGGYTDFYDIIANVSDAHVGGRITTEITNAGTTPLYNDSYVATAYQTAVLSSFGINAAEVDFLTRETTLDSANLSLYVSEPASLAIFGLGLLGLAGAARRKA